MNRIRLLAVGATLMFGLTALAQQAATSSGSKASGMPTVEDHLKLLSEKLDLTADQQVKFKPILQEMQDSTQKLRQDETLSREERMAKMKACHDKADKKARQILNDDQKKKLDQLEQEPYPEQHGDTNGATPPARAPQN